MCPTRKCILQNHVNDQVIRTTPDHSLYVEGKGRVRAGEMSATKSEGEQEFVHYLGERRCPSSPCSAS